MNKADLIAKISDKSGLTKKQSEAALNGFMASVEEALKEGDKIALIGFGTFETKERAARQGRNPRNPEQVIEIPASKAVTFKTSSKLKEIINCGA